MKTPSHLLKSCLLLSAVSCAYAVDDYMPALDGPKPISSYESAFAGEVYAGYQTTYEYKNIPVTNDLNRSGWFTFGGQVDAPFGSVWQQHVLADYSPFCDGLLKDKEVFNAGWAADREILPNIRAGAGYNLNYGGLPGFVTKVRGKATHSLAQNFDAYVIYDDPGTGYFGVFDVQAGFYGLTGWRFDLGVGKRWEGFLSKNIDAELGVGMGVSTSYWASGINGVDQFNIKFSLPIYTSLREEGKGLSFIPFIQVIWAGDTASDINRACGRPTVDAFELIGGIGVSFKF